MKKEVSCSQSSYKIIGKSDKHNPSVRNIVMTTVVKIIHAWEGFFKLMAQL